MRITMKQIAERAGVSQGAVSAVLKNVAGIRVSAPTRERVLEIARELNYRPDFAAGALKTGKTGLLGFICGGLHMPYIAETATALMQAVQQNGRHLLIMPLDWELQNDEEILEKTLDLVDGVFMISTLFRSEAQCEQVRRRQVPLVLLTHKAPGLPGVSIDWQLAMEKAFRHLTANGHRRIALTTDTTSHTRIEVYRKCCEEYGVEPIFYFYEIEEDMRQIFDCADEIIRNRRNQTALIAGDYGLSIMYHRLTEAGLVIPRDLSLVTIAGRMTPTRLIRPAVCTIRIDYAALARRSVEVMERQLTALPEERIPESLTLTPEFIPGASVADLRMP